MRYLADPAISSLHHKANLKDAQHEEESRVFATNFPLKVNNAFKSGDAIGLSSQKSRGVYRKPIMFITCN